MSRSLKKGPYINPKILKKVLKLKEEGKRGPIKVWDKACVITPDMVGMNFEIHNGKDFIPVLVNEFMVGFRFGEFVLTTNFKGHSKKGKIAKTYGSTGRFE
ncbi:30S ribosomal protein S19 [Candidatus Dojkabacteria bacterium]|nr:30S ribosomal protein S19 [Candidatus Dojkabacteria bacterium]